MTMEQRIVDAFGAGQYAYVTLWFVDEDQNEVEYRVRVNTEIEDIIEAYCYKSGKQSNLLRFLYNGVRLHPNDTPMHLGMQENDVIEVYDSRMVG